MDEIKLLMPLRTELLNNTVHNQIHTMEIISFTALIHPSMCTLPFFFASLKPLAASRAPPPPSAWP